MTRTRLLGLAAGAVAFCWVSLAKAETVACEAQLNGISTNLVPGRTLTVRVNDTLSLPYTVREGDVRPEIACQHFSELWQPYFQALADEEKAQRTIATLTAQLNGEDGYVTVVRKHLTGLRSLLYRYPGLAWTIASWLPVAIIALLLALLLRCNTGNGYTKRLG